MILSGQSIRAAVYGGSSLMIRPFVERTVEFGMSYGLSVAGYDIRIKDDHYLEPHGFLLATTVEYFEFPTDLLGVLADKSSWARKGVAIQHTIFEPGWKGYPTIELSNHGGEGVYFKSGMPIGQMLFHMLDRPAEAPYSGKYQDQRQIPTPSKDETSCS